MFWTPDREPPSFEACGLAAASARPRQTLFLVRAPAGGALGVGFGGRLRTSGAWICEGVLPGIAPESLGAASFLDTHRVASPYIAGAMAHGIASVELVSAMAEARMLAFFGTGGLPLQRIESAIEALSQTLDPRGLSWGANLIHAPDNPALEQATIDLYLEHGVRRVSASAYMRLTPSLVEFACRGLSLGEGGRIERRHHVFAKLSRPRIAKHFLSPAPQAILRKLVEEGRLSGREAELAARVPVAEDVTVEADSGGHTDNRPLTAVLPAVLALRDELCARHGYERPVRVGAAGGLGTPGAVAAAFAMGADYVLTGSVNQGSVESGLSPEGKEMLAAMDVADVIMAPSPDMFEQGIQVQVLKRGTLFAARARRLYELYRTYDSLEDLPAAEVERLEKEIFRQPLEEVWRQTREYLSWRNPRELERAEREPKHKMARVFRWYVGKTSHWAVSGESARKSDYQIWSGPAMGAFNAWTRGTFLADPARRSVVEIARQLLEGAAVVSRAQQLRSLGLPVPPSAFDYRPAASGSAGVEPSPAVAETGAG